ncbi:senescence-induced receptor-like serine/threonine-protein kinase [Typha angustifolia]|uniref:senescence-induced receptor-like serine/threonine-protein kinase n=1 Tax=Typha angustifolia TaxID=59011 RepID=UPI003C2C4ADE
MDYDPFSLLFLLSLLSSFFYISALSQAPKLSGFLIDCGSVSSLVDARGLTWSSDDRFISSGVPLNVSIPGLEPTLSTLRSFPYRPSSAARNRKFCYIIPIYRGGRYLVRTTYFYGGVNGLGAPPVFDQIVDGTFWTKVNTTADYAAGMSSYYEAVFLAKGKTISVCIAGNAAYTESDPFISALEVILLDNSVYNATNFNENAMGLIARSKFGSPGPIERYPDDRYDRYWQPFIDNSDAVSSTHNVTVTNFWNHPPADVFSTALVAAQDGALVLQWPPLSLPNSSYYIALYFGDTLPDSFRSFNVFINDYIFYNRLSVTSSGLVVFATPWILSGETRITLTPESVLPPLINAGEVFGLFPLGRVTHTRDVISLEKIKESINNPPDDWYGDPCMPQGYSWTGISCSEGASRVRVVTLNLSSMGVSGSLSPHIANLTALTAISFADNNISGTIPDLSKLNWLERLHLQDNHLTGTIPQSLGNVKKLRELYLQNNDLGGQVPTNVLTKPGLDLKLTPGNNFSSSPPAS